MKQRSSRSSGVSARWAFSRASDAAIIAVKERRAAEISMNFGVHCASQPDFDQVLAHAKSLGLSNAVPKPQYEAFASGGYGSGSTFRISLVSGRFGILGGQRNDADFPLISIEEFMSKKTPRP
jgi:hypothetical protein